MSSVLKPLLTPQEYLAHERQADYKSEYFRGETFAMAGASWEHNIIALNVAGETRQQLKASSCSVASSDLRVKVNATGLYTYPDIIVVCDKPEFEDGVFDTLLNPRVLIEVLSDSTEEYDRGTKFKHYRKIPSLQEYVLISQNEPLLERHVRQSNGDWLLTDFGDQTQPFVFASIPVKLAFADIYRGVEFPENAGR